MPIATSRPSAITDGPEPENAWRSVADGINNFAGEGEQPVNRAGP